MGGNVPIGYDIPAPGTRTLQVNQSEAATVRHIFTLYLQLGSVHALQRRLAEEGILSKQRVTGSGRTVGGLPFSRGALFHLLRSRIYLGEIPHKGTFHQGEHAPIVPTQLFDRVQQKLDGNARRHQSASKVRARRSPLTGRLFDADGEAMSPSFSRGSSGKLYQYYVSASLQQGMRPPKDEVIRRIPAPAIEKLLTDLVARWLPSCSAPLELLLSVQLRRDSLLIDLPAGHAADVAANLSGEEEIVHQTRQAVRITVPIVLPLRGGRTIIAAGAPHTNRPDATLIGALRKAHGMLSRERGLPVMSTSPDSPYDRKILRLAFLAPDLQRDILAGHQPASLNLERLRRIEIPLCWRQQRVALGWPAAA